MKTHQRRGLWKALCYAALITLLLSSCTAALDLSDTLKYAPQAAKADLDVLRTTYQEAHPSLYWYATPDSIDHRFNTAYEQLTDSITETGLFRLISYTLAPIHCGHSSVKFSKKTVRARRRDMRRQIPFEMKYVGDTALVTAIYRRADTSLKYGTQVKAINGMSVTTIRDSLFQFMSSDGYNNTVKYAKINANFSGYHRLVFGTTPFYTIEFIKSSGVPETITLSRFDPALDSIRRQPGVRMQMSRALIPSKRERLRKLMIDTLRSTAMLTVNTFEARAHLGRFFRKSFRSIRQKGIRNLIIDLRQNGGGNISKSALLAKYIANKPFKVADSAYAIKRSGFTYSGDIHNHFFYWALMNFVTTRKKDNRYHFTYLEKHRYQPKKNNHFNGHVYVLTSGATFSASTLFLNHVRGQQNVTIAGEETGGGFYGSSAINTPDIVLPNTGIRVRLPLFRLVMDKDRTKTGRGFFPDYTIPLTTESLKKRTDLKMDFVRMRIAETEQALKK